MVKLLKIDSDKNFEQEVIELESKTLKRITVEEIDQLLPDFLNLWNEAWIRMKILAKSNPYLISKGPKIYVWDDEELNVHQSQATKDSPHQDRGFIHFEASGNAIHIARDEYNAKRLNDDYLYTYILEQLVYYMSTRHVGDRAKIGFLDLEVGIDENEASLDGIFVATQNEGEAEGVVEDIFQLRLTMNLAKFIAAIMTDTSSTDSYVVVTKENNEGMVLFKTRNLLDIFGDQLEFVKTLMFFLSKGNIDDYDIYIASFQRRIDDLNAKMNRINTIEAKKDSIDKINILKSLMRVLSEFKLLDLAIFSLDPTENL